MKSKAKTKKDYFQSVVDLDFMYVEGCEHYYDSDRDCDSAGCDDICRCKKITNAEITSIPHVDAVIKKITNSKDEIVRYGIDRILTKFKIYDIKSFEMVIAHGYYGDEVESILAVDAEKIQKEIEKFLILETLSDKIEYLLTLEYGYLLKDIKNRDWSIETIATEDIDIQTIGYKKLGEECERYKKYSLPRGVVILSNGYQLVDGFHRITTAINNSLEEVSVFVGRE